jgi:hypothetical protein
MKSPDLKKQSLTIQAVRNKLTPDEARLYSEFMYKSFLTAFYRKALIFYSVLLTLILLWPFDFRFFAKTNHAQWADASPGIAFTGEGQAISNSFSIPFFEKLLQGSGFSIEVWVRPDSDSQDGPARIVSYSLNPSYRNFTLAQQGQDLIMRMRTENTDPNGIKPMLSIKDIFSHPKPLHIVVSYNFQQQKVYVNGRMRVASAIPGGDFKNWDYRYRLVLGNEATGDRPWLGKISYVAIYNTPLDAREVQRNYDEVRNWILGSQKAPAAGEGLVVRYLMDEKKGKRITDSGTLANPLNLYLPETIETENKPFLKFSKELLLPSWGSGAFHEIILNVLLFTPLAFFLHGILRDQMSANWKTLLVVIATGFTITISVEALQYFSPFRTSSFVDVIANLAGVLIGLLMKLVFDASLKRNTATISKAFGRTGTFDT